MKKQNLQNLKLNKKPISHLQGKLQGGKDHSGTCQSLDNCTWSGQWTCHKSCQGSCNPK
ncbi:hypothetical protein [Kordia sp.]|uniref:hypothetical protein n=1 Tax=Kordia sp. TaxID=1965332 RepID=UPI003D6A7FBA